MRNSIEIMLDLIRYVQGELFNDARAIDINSYSHCDDSFVTLELRNKDIVKIQVEYKPHVEEQGDVEK